MRNEKSAAALVAISICEALMISLIERGLLGWDDLQETLESAMDSHLHARPNDFSEEDHKAAARMIKSILRRSDAAGSVSRR
jgi:hypothetical protein